MHELAGAPHWRDFADAVDWSADLRPALRRPNRPGKQALTSRNGRGACVSGNTRL